MRYQEWMANDPNPPSMHNFRMATVEIYQERCLDGAMVFLAKQRRNDHGDTSSSNNSNYYCNDYEDDSVGAAELSPIELKDVIVHSDNIDNNNLLRYVTDVVTSSYSRRLGVGSILMKATEKSAWDLGTRCLLLHVEEYNMMARRFYEKLNYVYVGADDNANSSFGGDGVASLKLEATVGHTINIDTSRLAMNAGTTGQLLMMKELSEPVLQVQEETVNETSREVIKGFGMKTSKRVKKKKRT